MFKKIKNETLALGLMSGTSADGVSAVLCGFSGRKIRLVASRTFPYPKKLSDRILNASSLRVPGVSGLNFELGKIFAEQALAFLKSSGVRPESVAVIGSHGQTVYHGPEDPIPSTLQIGEPSVIAFQTGITTVSDFRSADIAAGGEGAPLIPFFDKYFFGDGPARALQNVGGIANVTVVGKHMKTLAFDTGPGNCLIDWAVKKISKGKLSYDAGGRLAKKGSIMMQAVESMSAHPYFSKRPPKSTGRELFNENFLPTVLKKALSRAPADALRTLTYFTAVTIAESYKKFVFPRTAISEVIVSGGGALNRTLMWDLQNLIYPVPLRSIESYGVPLQAKEPAAFAFFALCALQGCPNHCPEATGAKRPWILGKISPGKKFKGFQ